MVFSPNFSEKYSSNEKLPYFDLFGFDFLLFLRMPTITPIWSSNDLGSGFSKQIELHDEVRWIEEEVKLFESFEMNILAVTYDP